MTAFSNYLEDALVNATLRNVSYTSPGSVYLGLHTSAPNDDDSGSEVGAAEYSRTLITFSAPTNGSSSNNGTVTFPEALSSWGDITHFGIYDGTDPSDNLLYWGALATTKSVNIGDILTVPADALTVTLQ